MKNRANSDLLESLLPKPESFEIVAHPIATSYVVNIDEEFTHPKQFADLVHILEQAGEHDHVRMNITTVGGALNAVLPLLGAMKETLAHVHVHIVSDTASAGTFIVLKADTVSINDYVTFMCHNVSFGSGGQGNIVHDHVNYTVKSSNELLKDMYKGFFTPAEIDRMLSGKEYYMGKDEFLLRYEDKINFEEQEELAAARKLQEESLKALKKPSKPRAKKVDSKVAKTDTKPSEGYKGLEDAYDMPEDSFGITEEERIFMEQAKQPRQK
jgi:ATP-dependent protease ClpP protease subunit